MRLLEPVTIPPNTEVEVIVPESEDGQEPAFLQLRLEAAIISDIRRPASEDQPLMPLPNAGEPLSDTIIRERR